MWERTTDGGVRLIKKNDPKLEKGRRGWKKTRMGGGCRKAEEGTYECNFTSRSSNEQTKGIERGREAL